jgi:ATP-dependent Lhr-like helicase
LERFHPAVRRWFRTTLGEPTPPQELGWPLIAGGQNVLVLAPTGSGKTLAAFLWAIHSLLDRDPEGVEVLYVSPLKALSNDIEKNLRVPLDGIAGAGGIRVAVRTGDTPQNRRREMAKRPPHILITTPESLYVLLTGPLRDKIFAGLKTVIVDEVHSIAGNKRGAHLTLSLERLVEVCGEFQRIGLSATVRPADEIARFLAGDRPVEVLDSGRRRNMDVQVLSTVEDYASLPGESMWDAIVPQLVSLVRAHRTTLVFVQNRGQAERIAAWINDEAGDRLAEAYHGSMARAARLDVEARLKAGELRCLVSTAALELGIDIGSIELVVQLQSPKGVGRALQRVGRAGHLVGGASKGRFFPTFRDDLAECAVVASLMDGDFLEPTRVVRNATDVLAQQIVAAAATGPVEIDRLYEIARRSYCYRDLPRSLFDRVIEMAAGRGVGDLRAAVSLDAVHGRLMPLSRTRRLAVLGGGTIPDRGLYPAYLEGKKTRLGELDEEFVYETPAGTAFVLGSSVYRLKEVTAHHVIIEPAPGALLPKLPFWKGEGIGRSYELSLELGRFRRELDLDDPNLLEALESRCHLDRRSAWNLREYYRRQRDEAGPLPHDRRILVETFPDELGNWRMVIHAVFGRRVNQLLEMVAARRAGPCESLSTDDGLLLVFPAGERPAANPLRGLSAAAAAEQAKTEVLGSALFATRFRHCAERALILTKPLPNRRAPLYLNRIRANNLLAQAANIPEFPLIGEAARECLEEVLDYENFLRVVAGIETGEIEIAEVERRQPTPFAGAMQFAVVGAFLYEFDAPAAERAAQLLAVNRDVLAQSLSAAELERLVRPEAIEAVEAELQFRTPVRRARSSEDLLEILVRVGDLTASELDAVCAGPGLLEPLVADGRAIPIEIAGETRWIAAEDRVHYDPQPDDHVVDRWIAARGPFRAEDLRFRYGVAWQPGDGLARLGDRLCARPVLQRIHRASLGLLRREIEPRPVDAYARFALAWQHVTRRGALVDVLEKLEGFALPADAWRDIVGPRLAAGWRDLDDAVRAGDVLAAGLRPGWFAFIGRGRTALFLPEAPELARAARTLLDFLAEHGEATLIEIRRETTLSLAAVNTALAELFWAGQITCDSLREIERLGRPRRSDKDADPARLVVVDAMARPPRREAVARFRQAFRRAPGWEGRWRILRRRAVAEETRREEVTRVALARYGVLAREWWRLEDPVLPWSALYPVLERMEWRGELRRGHFVEGLAGMQFCLPDAVEKLRSVGATGEVTLNACDPANPYPDRRRPSYRVRLREGRFVECEPAASHTGLGSA